MSEETTVTEAKNPAPEGLDPEEYRKFREWSAAQQNAAVDPAPEGVEVRNPDGSTTTVSRDSVKTKPEPVEEEAEPESYVHLANGQVLRLKESDLPGYAGSNAQHGHVTLNGAVHTVIGVYPVETATKEG